MIIREWGHYTVLHKGDGFVVKGTDFTKESMRRKNNH
jgi:hypothetical protein